MQRKTIQKITLAMSLATLLTASNNCLSQTFRVNHGGKTGHAFTTHEGTISALHVGGLNFNYYYPALDIMIDTRSKSANGFKTSDKPASYFIDRRGIRHNLNAIGNHHGQTITSLRFFPGESGMPIFANDGSVCGVVLGNVLQHGRWSGRMSRITPLLASIKTDGTRDEEQ